MENEIIIVKQLPIIEEQLRTVQQNIQARVDDVLAMDCTEETYKEVKKARAELNAQFRELEARRKAVKSQVEAPYKAFEKVYKDCAADIFAKADKELSRKIKSVEDNLKAQKTDAVVDYFVEYRGSLGIPTDLAQWDLAGINITLSASEKSLKKQAKDYLDRVRDDFKLMVRHGDDFNEILYEYRRCHNAAEAVQLVFERKAAIKAEQELREAQQKRMEDMETRENEVISAIEEEEQISAPEPTDPPADELHIPVSTPVCGENAAEEATEEPVAPVRKLSVSFRVIGTLEQLRAMKKFLIDGGYEYEQLG